MHLITDGGQNQHLAPCSRNEERGSRPSIWGKLRMYDWWFELSELWLWMRLLSLLLETVFEKILGYFMYILRYFTSQLKNCQSKFVRKYKTSWYYSTVFFIYCWSIQTSIYLFIWFFHRVCHLSGSHTSWIPMFSAWQNASSRSRKR